MNITDVLSKYYLIVLLSINICLYDLIS